EVIINGISREVEKVIINPGYKKTPADLEQGDAAPLMAFKSRVDDIALIKLKRPVIDVLPASLYKGRSEKGQIAEIIGCGATGNGLTGQDAGSPHRGKLRRAYSRVVDTTDRWILLRFDAPPMALPMQGSPSDGDSGSPVLINVKGRPRLAGLVSGKYATGKLADFHFSLYGQITFQVRLSRYIDWIDMTTGIKI
ncbi:MAG TPA: trypsin-like serine protease, partial [Puia sp.]|nr:trypsin-like serine protease [Puia sp.]